jgi:hypothetical protein
MKLDLKIFKYSQPSIFAGTSWIQPIQMENVQKNPSVLNINGIFSFPYSLNNIIQ